VFPGGEGGRNVTVEGRVCRGGAAARPSVWAGRWRAWDWAWISGGLRGAREGPKRLLGDSAKASQINLDAGTYASDDLAKGGRCTRGENVSGEQ
jgi:hypothetical protein